MHQLFLSQGVGFGLRRLPEIPTFLFPSQGSCVAEPEATFPISAKPRTLRSLIRLSPPPSSPLNFLQLPQISVGLLPVAQTKLPIAC